MNVGKIDRGVLPEQVSQISSSNPLQALFERSIGKVESKSPSLYRQVFQTTTEMKKQFSDFLRTIFFQLDEKKVFALMDEILADTEKTDESIYQELLAKIDTAKKPLAVLSMLKALHVVRKGMGMQAAELISGFDKASLKSYIEIYNRRYASEIQSSAGLSFQKTAAICDKLSIDFKDRIEAGSILYPYQKLIHLNDLDCENPGVDVLKTYKPIGEEVDAESVDIVSCLGGLHHIPEDRIEPFIQSIAGKMKPGAVCLLREHDAGKEEVKALASVIHSFVNAVDGTPFKQESLEIRNFQPEAYWTALMEKQGFSRLDKGSLILKNDPTRNAMMAFVKNPKTSEEIEKAAVYQKDFARSKIGSYATWIEWGNVRFSKQYAEFIQDHHSYAFDFLGHAFQHWTHFYYTIKQSLSEPDNKMKEVVFSDNMAMNLFIVLATTVQLGFSSLVSFPSSCLAKLRYGDKWREVAHLNSSERFEAKFQKDYSTFIDYDPFFKYPYFKTIQNLWKTVATSKESELVKLQSSIGALGLTVSLAMQGLISTFINSIYYSEGSSSDQEVIQVLLNDPLNEMDLIIEKWNQEKSKVVYKGKKPYENCLMKVIYSSDGKKLVSMPFYKPFTEIVKLFAESKGIQLCKVGGQEKITLDLCLQKEEKAPSFQGSEVVYEMERLQDTQERRYATYEVEVNKLHAFCRDPKVLGHLEYIHAHR